MFARVLVALCLVAVAVVAQVNVHIVPHTHDGMISSFSATELGAFYSDFTPKTVHLFPLSAL
jgi:hypothetical protein